VHIKPVYKDINSINLLSQGINKFNARKFIVFSFFSKQNTGNFKTKTLLTCSYNFNAVGLKQFHKNLFAVKSSDDNWDLLRVKASRLYSNIDILRTLYYLRWRMPPFMRQCWGPIRMVYVSPFCPAHIILRNINIYFLYYIFWAIKWLKHM